jgi:hypothetical protein
VDDARTVLLVVGSQDRTGLAESGLRTAAMLAATSAAVPIVAGEQGRMLELADAMGLEAIELANTRWDRRRDLAHLAGTADVVHALGLRAAVLVAAAGLPTEQPIAVTVDAVAARIGGRSPFAALRNRAGIRWLVPGRTATTSLVYRGLVPGDRVMTLPVLGYAANPGIAWSAWPAVRAAARRRLGVPPGVHVVVGFGPGRARGLRYLEVLAARGEPILPCWIESEPGRRQSRRLRLVGAAEGRQLFAAMDVLVADGCAIAAAHPAVDARQIGVPIVSTAADVAAGLVVHSRNGYIATPAELDGAIAAALAMAVARTLRPQSEQHGLDERERQAGITAGCYSALLGHPLVRPVLMGRRASR